MCRCDLHGSCFGCSHAVSRRRFIKGCGATMAAVGGLTSAASGAEESQGKRVRVALVFLSKPGSSWPYPGFDVQTRQNEVIGCLQEGCPQIEFVPTVIRDPGDVQKAIALKDEVDGYLVYIVTLNWNLQRTLTQIGRLEKPMLVADEYLGGSGVFLRGYSDLCRQDLPAAGVASTRPEDLVLVARQFADVKQPDVTPASFAERCRQVYRKTFATGEMECLDDPLALTDVGKCLERFKKSRFLIVGAGPPGRVQDFLGAEGIHVGFDEFKAVYEKVDQDEATEWARRWSQQADKVVEPTPDWIHKAGAVYLATLELLEKHGTDSVTMNCLGGFGRGLLPAYPCLGFMQILDDGGQGVCEAMPDDTLSMLMARILTGRPGYVSDPVLDTSKNQIVYAHCVATTKVFGPQGDANMFRIRTLHNRDPRGTCAQSFLPPGYMTTSFRTNFARKQMVIHRAKAVGNLDSERGCRTQLVGEVAGDIGKLFDQWDHFSWHRVTVFGDVMEPLVEFGKALGLETVVEV